MVAPAISGLKIGCDVDWCKTNPVRKLYHKARSKGTSVPALFKARGFDHVRIRIREYRLAEFNPDTGLTLLEEIARVVDDCLSADLIPIVAFQAEDFKLNPTPEERDRVVAWWQVVANRLAGRPAQLAYNNVIETTGAIRDNDAALNDLHCKVYDAIQAIDPGRLCIACPNKISSPEKLPALQVPGEYCFVESHFYAAGPSKSNPEKQWTTGTEAEKQILLNKINLIIQWQNEHSIPVWVGAIMSANFNSDDGGDLTSEYTVAEQVEFVQFVMGELKAAGIPVAWNSDTKFFDLQSCQWITQMEPVLNAILAQ